MDEQDVQTSPGGRESTVTDGMFSYRRGPSVRQRDRSFEVAHSENLVYVLVTKTRVRLERTGEMTTSQRSSDSPKRVLDHGP